MCRLKSPTVISIWLLEGIHPATQSVQSIPADNTPKRVWQYIENKKRKKVTDCDKVPFLQLTVFRIAPLHLILYDYFFSFSSSGDVSIPNIEMIRNTPGGCSQIQHEQYNHIT